MFANPKLAAGVVCAVLLGGVRRHQLAAKHRARISPAFSPATSAATPTAPATVYRHPKETLLFFGIRPETSVLEVWPEPGWYTEIIAPLVREKGRYYAALIAPDPSSAYNTKRLDSYHDKLAARPDLYDKVQIVTLPTDGRGRGARPARWTWS